MAGGGPRRRPGLRVARGLRHDGGVPEEVDEQTPPERVVVTPQLRDRILRSPKDITLSLLALLVPIAIALIAYRTLGGEAPTSVRTDDLFNDARASHRFAVLEPSLTKGWRPTIYDLTNDGTTTTLRVSYTTPGGRGLQLLETNAPAGTVQAQELAGDFEPAGAAEVNGHTWQVLQTSRGEQVLVLDDGGRVVLIKGDAGLGEMKDFAGLLR